MASERFVRECRPLVAEGNLDALIELVESHHDDPGLAWDFIAQKLYLYACLKRQTRVADWIETQSKRLDPIQQSALRPGLAYGRYIRR